MDESKLRILVVLLVISFLAPTAGSIAPEQEQVVSVPDIVSGGNPDLQGVTFYDWGMRIDVVTPIGKEFLDDIMVVNVSIGIIVILDVDYNLSTGYQLPLAGGYYLVGGDAAFGVIINWTWEPRSGGSFLIKAELAEMSAGFGRSTDVTDLVDVTVNESVAVIRVNWTGLLEAYKNMTGKDYSETIRLFSIAENAFKRPIAKFANSTVFARTDVKDFISSCPNYTVSNATIVFTGSPSDWPPDTQVCTDSDEPNLPGYSDLVGYYLSNDRSQLYVGTEFRGGDFGDFVIWRVFSLSAFNNDDDPYPENSIATSYSNFSGEKYVGLAYFDQGLVGLPQDVLAYNITDEIFEVSGPNNSMVRALMPGRTVEPIEMFTAVYAIDLLEPPNDRIIQIYEVLLNVSTGELMSYGNYTVKVIPVGPGPGMAETVDASLYVNATDTVTVTLGRLFTPPMNAKLPEVKNGELLGYYYFSVDNTSLVSWPLHFYVPYKGSGEPLVYYYDKVSGSYEPVPEGLIRYHEENKTVEIVFTEELYNRGDPGIIIYSVTPTIGGFLLTPPAVTSDGLYMVAAGLLVVAGFIVVASRVVRPRI